LAEVCFDIASAQVLGRRDCQEDALVAHFAQGSDLGFVVLADGMGGHAAGDIAAKIVVTEVFSELLFQGGDVPGLQDRMPQILRDAVRAADECIAGYVASNPAARGMGATLIAPVILHRALWWISIGDSPLFLFRDGSLQQLNEDHSLAPQIDFMAANGLMDRATAQCHPDRNVLTSVLCGGIVARVDCPDSPMILQEGDILIVASDGLQFLDIAAIAATLVVRAEEPSGEIARILLADIARLDDPDQDNVSFCVIKILPESPAHNATDTPWRRHMV
jgi:PPM family protein phosphatase